MRQMPDYDEVKMKISQVLFQLNNQVIQDDQLGIKVNELFQKLDIDKNSFLQSNNENYVESQNFSDRFQKNQFQIKSNKKQFTMKKLDFLQKHAQIKKLSEQSLAENFVSDRSFGLTMTPLQNQIDSMRLAQTRRIFTSQRSPRTVNSHRQSNRSTKNSSSYPRNPDYYQQIISQNQESKLDQKQKFQEFRQKIVDVREKESQVFESKRDINFSSQIGNFKMNDYLFCRNDKKTWFVNQPQNDKSSITAFTKKQTHDENSQLSSNFQITQTQIQKPMTANDIRERKFKSFSFKTSDKSQEKSFQGSYYLTNQIQKGEQEVFQDDYASQNSIYNQKDDHQKKIKLDGIQQETLKDKLNLIQISRGQQNNSEDQTPQLAQPLELLTQKELANKLKFIHTDTMVKSIGLTNLRTNYLTQKLFNNVGTRLLKNYHPKFTDAKRNVSSPEKRDSIESRLSNLLDRRLEIIEGQEEMESSEDSLIKSLKSKQENKLKILQETLKLAQQQKKEEENRKLFEERKAYLIENDQQSIKRLINKEIENKKQLVSSWFSNDLQNAKYSQFLQHNQNEFLQMAEEYVRFKFQTYNLSKYKKNKNNCFIKSLVDKKLKESEKKLEKGMKKKAKEIEESPEDCKHTVDVVQQLRDFYIQFRSLFIFYIQISNIIPTKVTRQMCQQSLVMNSKDEKQKKIYQDPSSYFYRFDNSIKQDLLPWENKSNLSDYLVDLLDISIGGECLSNFDQQETADNIQKQNLATSCAAFFSNNEKTTKIFQQLVKDIAQDFQILKNKSRGGFDEIDKSFSKKLCSFLSLDSNKEIKDGDDKDLLENEITQKRKINITQEILSFQNEIILKKLYIYRDKQGRQSQLLNYKGEIKQDLEELATVNFLVPILFDCVNKFQKQLPNQFSQKNWQIESQETLKTTGSPEWSPDSNQIKKVQDETFTENKLQHILFEKQAIRETFNNIIKDELMHGEINEFSDLKKMCLDWEMKHLQSETVGHLEQPSLPPFAMIKEGTFFMYNLEIKDWQIQNICNHFCKYQKYYKRNINAVEISQCKITDLQFARILKVFQDFKIKRITYQCSQLYEKSAFQLFDMISEQQKGFSEIIQINFNSLQTHPEALVKFFQAMNQNHSIRILQFFDINLSNQSVFKQIKIWLESLSSIQQLEFCNCNFNPDQLVQISKSILEISSIEFLNLSYNTFDRNEKQSWNFVKLLASMIETNLLLTHLNLQGMSLGNRATIYIANSINKSLSLIGVHLSGNNLSEDAQNLIYCMMNINKQYENKNERKIMQDMLYKEVVKNCLKRSIYQIDKFKSEQINDNDYIIQTISNSNSNIKPDNINEIEEARCYILNCYYLKHINAQVALNKILQTQNPNFIPTPDYPSNLSSGFPMIFSRSIDHRELQIFKCVSLDLPDYPKAAQWYAQPLPHLRCQVCERWSYCQIFYTPQTAETDFIEIRDQKAKLFLKKVYGLDQQFIEYRVPVIFGEFLQKTRHQENENISQQEIESRNYLQVQPMVYVSHYALNFIMPRDYHKESQKELRQKLIYLLKYSCRLRKDPLHFLQSGTDPRLPSKSIKPLSKPIQLESVKITKFDPLKIINYLKTKQNQNNQKQLQQKPDDILQFNFPQNYFSLNSSKDKEEKDEKFIFAGFIPPGMHLIFIYDPKSERLFQKMITVSQRHFQNEYRPKQLDSGKTGFSKGIESIENLQDPNFIQTALKNYEIFRQKQAQNQHSYVNDVKEPINLIKFQGEVPNDHLIQQQPSQTDIQDKISSSSSQEDNSDDENSESSRKYSVSSQSVSDMVKAKPKKIQKMPFEFIRSTKDAFEKELLDLKIYKMVQNKNQLLRLSQYLHENQPVIRLWHLSLIENNPEPFKSFLEQLVSILGEIPSGELLKAFLEQRKRFLLSRSTTSTQNIQQISDTPILKLISEIKKEKKPEKRGSISSRDLINKEEKTLQSIEREIKNKSQFLRMITALSAIHATSIHPQRNGCEAYQLMDQLIQQFQITLQI